MYGSAISLKKNLNYIRIILSFCLLLLGFYNYDFIIKNPVENLIYFFVLITSNILIFLTPQKFFKDIKFNYIVFLMDISFIVIGLTLFTAVDIPFIICIFLALFMAALSKSSAFSLVIAIILNAVYIYMKVGTSFAFENLNETFFLNMPFIFIVSLHSTYLAEKVEEEVKEKMQLEKINKFLFNKKKTIDEEFSDFSGFIQTLFDNLNQGILFVDNDGYLIIFSKRCEKILGIKESYVVNRLLNDSKLPSEIIKKILDLKFKKIICKNERIKIENLNKEIYINVDFIKEDSGKIIGIICEISE